LRQGPYAWQHEKRSQGRCTTKALFTVVARHRLRACAVSLGSHGPQATGPDGAGAAANEANQPPVVGLLRAKTEPRIKSHGRLLPPPLTTSCPSSEGSTCMPPVSTARRARGKAWLRSARADDGARCIEALCGPDVSPGRSPAAGAVSRPRPRAAQFHGIHWGTFMLTRGPYNEPPKRIAPAVERLQLPAERIRILSPEATATW
jgi:hypothetical protein